MCPLEKKSYIISNFGKGLLLKVTKVSATQGRESVCKSIIILHVYANN